MLQSRRVLIAEDEPFTAYDLAQSIKEADGVVLGPIASVKEGLELVAEHTIHAAILDVQLADGEVTPLAHLLFERGVVVVFHTASPVPAEITRRHGNVPLCRKPMVSDQVVRHVAALMRQQARGLS